MLHQVRALFRVFLARFFENDLAADAGDFRLAFFALIALLAVPGIVAPILIATASMPGTPPQFGWIMTAHVFGVDALRRSVLSDKMLYLGYAMATSGLLASVAWQSLLPDRRDARVLMPFGLHPRAAMSAKLLALFTYLSLVAVAIHTLPSIVFGSLLAVDNTFTFALRGIAAHFAAAVGASLFVGLLLVAIQAVTMTLLGPGRFTRASSALHFVVVACSAMGLALLPSASVRLGEAFRSATPLSGAGRWIPTTWFLGLYESIVGTADPAMRPLALTAIASVAALLLLTLTLYPIVYRQTMNAALDEGVGHPRRPSLAAWFARGFSLLVARDQRTRAMAQFFAAALFRGARQRLALAVGAGAACASAIPAWLAAAHDGTPAIHVGSFAWPIAAMIFLTLALRLAAALPVEQEGDWLIDAANLDLEDARAVLVRAAWWLVIGPVIVVSTIVYGRWWGWAAAITHVAVASCLGAAIVELTIWRGVGTPCHGPWSMPLEQIRKWWPAFLIGGFFGISGLSGFEYLSMSHPIGAGVLSAWWLSIAVMVHGAMQKGLRGRAAAGDADATIVDALRAARLDSQGGETPERTRRAMPAPIFGAFQRRQHAEFWTDGIDLTPSGVWRDARFALRRLLRAPMFTFASIGVLAIGIGILVAARSLTRDFSGQSSVMNDADRVFAIGPSPINAISRADLNDLRERQSAFSAIEAYAAFPVTIAAPHDTLITNGQGVTGGYFGLLGIRPVIGRFIDPADDTASASLAAVLDERTWRVSFGADAGVIGTTVRIGGAPYTIVGVAPASLHVSRDGAVAIYVALSHLPATDRGLMTYRSLDGRGVRWLHAVGRLGPGHSEDEASHQIWSIGRALDVAAPLAAKPAVPVPRGWRLSPAADAGVRPDWDRGGQAMMLLPIAIFLIVCTSLANLVLSRSGNRRAEYGVRRALGASRANLVVEHVIEMTMVAAASGVAAWFAAQGTVLAVARLVARTYGQSARVHITTTLSTSDVWALVGLVALTVLVAGLIPAISLTAGSASSSITQTATATPRWRGRRVAIAVQVAVSLALQLVASLAVTSIQVNAEAFAKTEAYSHIAVASVPLSLVDRDDDGARAHAREIGGAIERLRTAEHVAVVSNASAAASIDFVRVSRPDAVLDADTRRSTGADPIALTEGGVRALGASLLRGRDIDAGDTAGAPLVAVISEKLAREEFGGLDLVNQNAVVISRDIRGVTHQDQVRIVGVAAQADTIRTRADSAAIYFPLAQRFTPDLLFIAHTQSLSQADQLAVAMRTAIRSVDAAIPVSFAGRGDVMVGAQWVVMRIGVEAVGAMSLFALIITMVGLYGVLSQTVALRRIEMGVRMALGASPRSILGLVVRDGGSPVVIGLATGVGLGAIGRLSAQPLFSRAVSAIDFSVAIVAIVPLIVAAAIACYVPARRASRIDPMRVLKEL